MNGLVVITGHLIVKCARIAFRYVCWINHYTVDCVVFTLDSDSIRKSYPRPLFENRFYIKLFQEQ